ncbi:STAS domain-containing protein [Kibdelosporangium philippinense]|uniref:Anti-sigma factor antagonist n=1 Tax=Kibdelosporangium philippinense TaxID=211113 RepID=A0ABS8Z8G7_9PSEU|nr:STAS domain-containing protein [Kibdelosporangium philippinense]MCE7003812.1 STAS domain-containing protein [Kibdelosporangium philippinense]
MVGELLEVKPLRDVSGARLLGLVGEVDLSTAPTLEKAIGTALGEVDGKKLILDMTGVTFLASAGMSALIAGREQAVAKGVEMVIVATPTGAAYRSLEIAGLIEVLSVQQEVTPPV